MPLRTYLWALLALALWLGSLCSASAASETPAQQLKYLLREIPGTNTHLPDYLTSRCEVYLLLTSSGADAQIFALARPEVAPTRLAQALKTSLASASLDAQTTTPPWTTGQYSVAYASIRRGHFGSSSATLALPLGALLAGLRRAGFSPYPLLRVPEAARAVNLPAPCDTIYQYSWYDARQLSGVSTVTTTISVSPGEFAGLFWFLLVPAFGFGGLAFALRRARNGDRSKEAQKRFDNIASGPLMLGFFTWILSQMFYIGKTPFSALEHLWFGSLSGFADTTVLIGSIMLVGIVGLVIQKQKMRLFGPSGEIPSTAYSPQERALREKEGMWGAATPLLLGAGALLVALGVSLGPLSHVPAPLLRFAAPLLLLVPLFFLQKRAKAFAHARDEADIALTDQAREIGRQMGARPDQVQIDGSARASQFLSFSTSGQNIVVSQKARETLTPDEMRFLLAHQVALLKSPDRSSQTIIAVCLSGLLVAYALPMTAFSVFHLHGSRVFPVVIVPLLAWFPLFFWLVFRSQRQGQRRILDADRAALEITGDAQAARSALDKLEQFAAPSGSSRAWGSMKREAAARRDALPSVSGSFSMRV